MVPDFKEFIVQHFSILQSMGFFRQECWSRLPFPSPGDLQIQGWNSLFLQLLHYRWILYHWATEEAWELRTQRWLWLSPSRGSQSDRELKQGRRQLEQSLSMWLNLKKVSVAVHKREGLHLVERVKGGFVDLVPFELTVNKNLKEGKMKWVIRKVSLGEVSKSLK